jgi:hypothetical protein
MTEGRVVMSKHRLGAGIRTTPAWNGSSAEKVSMPAFLLKPQECRGCRS